MPTFGYNIEMEDEMVETGKVVGVVTARMSSKRAPGKALTPILDRPLLEWVGTSLGRCETLDELVVATSTDQSDDAIANWCEAHGYLAIRGPLDDVILRLQMASEARSADWVVRISGDSPLIIPELVETLVAHALTEPWDLVTNVFPRTFPRGQSVEVMRRCLLEQLSQLNLAPNDREHVTSCIYRDPAMWSIRNVTLDDIGESNNARTNLSCLDLCFDKPTDRLRLESIINHLLRRQGGEYRGSEFILNLGALRDLIDLPSAVISK